jgi:hypothetical protein
MTAGRTALGDSRDWCTPAKYVKAVREVLGTIRLDPCSNAWSTVGADVEWRLPDDDGLKRTWDFSTIYVNPPYGSDTERGTRIIDWLQLCSDANALYGSEVIALVPVAGNTRHWKQYVWPTADAVCFLYDTRLRFTVNGKDDGKGAPMACAAIYWGSDKRRFARVFGEHGAVVDLATITLPKGTEQPKLELLNAARRYA